MIYSDRDIANEISLGNIKIDPFERKNIQPASLDVRLADSFLEYPDWRYGQGDPPITDPTTGVKMIPITTSEYILDTGGFVLGVTREKITLSSGIFGRMEGKSSLGRLGLAVHITAGFIDPGFSGYLTLELFNASPFPILLRAGMLIAQISFESTRHPCNRPYDGRYKDAGEKCEPTASRIHLNTGLEK